MGTPLICTPFTDCDTMDSEYLTKPRGGSRERLDRSRPVRYLTALAQLAAAILALSTAAFADVRGPYLLGRDSGSNIALLGFFLSLSIAIAGLWLFWYRRRGGSRLKSWIIAGVIAVGVFILIGVLTTAFLVLG